MRTTFLLHTISRSLLLNMFSRVISCVALAAVPVAAWEEGAQVYSAKCSAVAGQQPVCSVVTGEDSRAQAAATWQDDILKTGWGRLLVKTPSSEPGLPAFAAGYLEGYLTANRVAQHYNNSFQGAKLDPPPAGLVDFMEQLDDWWRTEIKAASPADPYWNATGFISDQLDGLVAGVNAGLAGQRSFSRTELLMLNSFWDLGDIRKAVDAEQRADFEAMTEDALSMYVRLHGHCSSIVKLLPDGSELYAAHNTWFEYYHLLRVWKRYEFGAMTPVAMSSYPGMISSSDDFYQVGHMLVMETTLPNYNNDLYTLIKPQSLPFWIRVMASNRLATDGPTWMETFKKHNSGTYNNMWIVVDYSKFTPSRPLVDGTLTIGEQLPGYFHYEDQTKTLSYGYWPSYNAARYPETARLIKQDVMEQTKGNSFSYQLVERAQIFRRDEATIKSDEDMQRIMRYNQFQSDPIASNDPCKQLACRQDLAPDAARRQAFGAIDGKYTSSAHNRRGEAVIVAGPTHDDQPVFDWSKAPKLAASTPHYGQPAKFDFDWLVVGPDLAAVPWEKSSGVSGAGAVAAAAAAAALTVCFMGVMVVRRQRAGKLDAVPDSSYAKMGSFALPKAYLQGSPGGSTRFPSSAAGGASTPEWVVSPSSSA